MPTVEFAILVALLVLIVVAHFVATAHHARFFQERVRHQDEEEEGRRIALYKMQKSAETEIAKQQTAMRVLADQMRAVHDEARLLHQRVDQYFAHPNVKRLTNEE